MAQDEAVTMERLVRARRIIRRLMKSRPSAKPILDRLNMEIRALRKVAK
jgi:hypothetical protein